MNYRRRPFAAGSGCEGAAWLIAMLLLATTGCDNPAPPPPPITSADSLTRYATSAPAEPAAAPTPRVLPPAPKPTTLLPLDTTCATAECHSSFTTARQIHGPVGSGDCFACHGEDTGEHHYPLLRGPIETCTFCHTVTGSRSHEHLPVMNETTGCIGCHDPHAGPVKFLLKANSTEQLCAKCHTVELKAHTHGPFAAGQCSLCHLPHEADNTKLLRGGEGPDHCYMCHSEVRLAINNSPTVHQPARDGCVTCHDPHSSNFSYELSAPVEKVCLSCHQDIEQEIATAATPHAALFTADKCANCHDAHASGRPHLLRERVDQLCLKCHDKPVTAADGRTVANMKPLLTGRQFLHGPVRAGDCTACHNVHGAAHSRLLTQQFPQTFYTDFAIEQYALCFTCHEQSLVTEPTTRHLTDFRDGDRNLHYLHVHRDKKGRTCKTCHAIHASDLPRHIATVVPFEESDWAMPIRFKQTPTGGSCAPGCHQPYIYDRNVPAVPRDSAPGVTAGGTSDAETSGGR